MKIRAIRLKNFRRFRDPIEIAGLSDGVNVLAGPNEAGKSTVYHALEAAFLTPHRVSGNVLETMRPHAGGEPYVEVEFETGGKLWRIEKQFGRGKAFVLRDLDAGREAARAADAEAALSSLLKLPGEGTGRLGLVWVRQQRTLSAPDPDLDHETGKIRPRGEATALIDVIGQEVESAADGELASRVARKAEAALAELVTLGREAVKKNGPLDQAMAAHDEAARRLEMAQRAAAVADQRLDRIAGLSTELAALTGATVLADLESDAQTLQARIAWEEKTRPVLALARQHRDTCTLEDEAAHKAFDDFSRAVAEAAALDAQTEAAKLERKRLITELEDAGAALAASSEALASAQDAARIHREQIAAWDRHAMGESLARRTDELRNAVVGADGLEETISNLRAALASDAATPERLAALSAIETRLAVAGAELNAASPVISYAILPEGAGKVRIAGESVTGKGEIATGASLDIEIENIAAFRVRAANDGSLAGLRQETAKLAKALAAALVEIGVTDVASARTRAAARAARHEELAAARARLSGLLPQGRTVAMRELQELSEKAMALSETGAPPVARADLEAGLRHGLAAITKLESDKSALGQRHAAIERMLAALDATETLRAAQTVELQARLVVFGPRGEAQARLQARVQDTAAAAASARLKCADLEAAVLSDASFAVLQVDAGRAHAALAKHRAEAQRLTREIDRLKAEQAGADEEGRANDLAAAQGDAERTQGEVERLRLEASALKLLVQTLQAEEERTRKDYFEPVARRLAPYLAHLFPQAAVAFGSDFSLEALVRAGEREEFARLSDGTREQLSVLVRMAFARLMAERGHAAPLILDDPLVYSDDARLTAMCRALEEAGRSHQVILLTCRETAFKTLTGRRLAIEPWQPV